MLPVTRTGSGTKDMAALMERVRRMSDSQLADILSGKDVSIPQYAAMTEAMGRKQLRQAVDGQQAQQQAQQPSVKDQLLAEQAQAQAQNQPQGIAGLPAPNMESIDMAGGGIIAFEDGGSVPGYAAGDYIDPLAELSGLGISGMGADEARREVLLARRKEREDKERLEFLKTAAPELAAKIMADSQPPVPPSTPPAAASAGTPSAKPDAAKPNAAAPGAGLPAIDVSQATKFERRANPFGQMSAEKVDFEGLKDKGLGEGLMKMAAGLMSAPGSKGFSAGIQALAESGAVSRKEINALKKDARDYDFNLKKADSAFEQGNDELGLKYMEAANLNKYRMASLAQEPGELRTLKAIQADPSLAAIYKGGNKGEMLTVKDATTAFNDIVEKNPRYAKELAGLGVKDPMAYRQYVLTGLPPMQVVGTIPGKDAVVRN